MTLPIDFRLEAVEEVEAAYAWYEEQRAGLGEEFLAAFLEQLERIAENPEGFPYVIYYRLVPDRINVIAVQHGHRNPRAWRRRA